MFQSKRQPRKPNDEPVAGGRVTAVSRQERHPERVKVFIDGEFAFGMDALSSYQEGVVIGAELSDERVEELRSLDDAGKATDAAIRFLTVRPRSVREIRDRLRQKGYSAETIDVAIERLESWRYVDDEAFARYWVENREAFKPRGKRLIEQELRFKGVDRQVVQRTVEDSEIDETAGAMEIARAKSASYRDLEPEVARRRLAGFLTRRGYGYGVIKPVVEAVFGEIHGENLSDGAEE